MLSENDKQTLLRNLTLNRVVLATGAGFSHECKNIHGKHLPSAQALASALYAFLYQEEYDGVSSLKNLYGAAQHRKGTAEVRQFLYSQLHAHTIPDWYRLIPLWFWRRIYTFNADDVIEQVYDPSTLSRIVAPDSFYERDQFLRKLQYIKLHGSVDDAKELTFGPREYASRAAARTDMWYLHFVEDYSTLSTVFIGTALDEPLFWQYIEARGAQSTRGEKVRRPKSFLVSPIISKPTEDALAQYNIIPVRATAQQFFTWLQAQQRIFSREDVLRGTNANLEPALQAAERGVSVSVVAAIEFFFTVFRIPVRPTNPRPSVMFLMGAPPTWDDIAGDVDAPREINDDLHKLLMEIYRTDSVDVVQVGSPAGGGKSTTCKRAALDLVDEGYTVFFSDASTSPDANRLADYILTLDRRCFLFFDNAGSDIPHLADLWKLLATFRHKPVFIVSSRSNDLAYYSHEFSKIGARVHDFTLGDLTDADCQSIGRRLDQFDLLGALKDKTEDQRLALFKEKARKQILVAMREVTSGRGFDEILQDEFRTLNTAEARLLYLIASIASDDDYGLSLSAMITAMGLPPNETTLLVEQSLKGILISQAERNTFTLRHPAIATFIISNAPRDILAKAFAALLISLASVMPYGKDRRKSRAFRLYRKLLNHTLVQNLFSSRRLARNIYEEIKEQYRDDGHYWLQYASYEIEGGGDIALADNYLRQAEVLLVNSRQVETATAHLLFRKAEYASNVVQATEYRDDALRILRSHMADSANVSLHALHIFGDKMAEYINRWVPTVERSAAFGAVKKELEAAIPEQLTGHRLLQATVHNLRKQQLETLVRAR